MKNLITITTGTVEAIKTAHTSSWYENSFYLIGDRDYETGAKMVITGRSIRVWQRARNYFKTMSNNPMMVIKFSDEAFSLIAEGLYATATKEQAKSLESINEVIETNLRAILAKHANRVGQECFDISYESAIKIIQEALSI